MTKEEALTQMHNCIDRVFEKTASFMCVELDPEYPVFSFHDFCRAIDICPYCIGKVMETVLNPIAITTEGGAQTIIPVVHRYTAYNMFLSFLTSVTREIQELYATIANFEKEETPSKEVTGEDGETIRWMSGLD